MTISSFTLFGFVFMVTQYFQFMKGYSPFSTGLALPGGLPTEAVHAAGESDGGAFIAAERLDDAGLGSAATHLRHAASGAFFDGFAVGCLVAAGVALLGAIVAAVLLPAHTHVDDDTIEWDTGVIESI